MHANDTNRYKYVGGKTKVCWSMLLAILLLTSYRTTVSAQVVINELGVLDSPDWIEIYNFEQQPIDLSLFKIKDDKGNELTLSGILARGGFKSFDWSNRLNNAGDIVWLVKVLDGSIIEELKYGEKGGVCVPSNVNGSIGKLTDGASGSERLERFSANSKEASNSNGAIDPCPTPTPEPTEKPTPTIKPTNTPTPKPENTKVPTSTPKPQSTKNPSPTSSSTLSNDSENGTNSLRDETSSTQQVLSEKDVNGEESKENVKKFPLFAIILVVTGIGMTGCS